MENKLSMAGTEISLTVGERALRNKYILIKNTGCPGSWRGDIARDYCQLAVVFEAEVRTASGGSPLFTSLVCSEQKQLFSSSH